MTATDQQAPSDDFVELPYCRARSCMPPGLSRRCFARGDARKDVSVSSGHPRISVIVPAYNVECYIGPALDSALGQSVPAHEVIIIDDGSTDGTADKIAGYAEHERVTVVRTENLGPGPARNEGLRRASGEYVYFFDADDVMRPHLLATVGAAIEQTGRPDVLLFSGHSFVDGYPDRNVDDNFMRPLAASGISGAEAVARLVKAGTPTPCAWLYVSRRSLWSDSLAGFKNIYYEDNERFLPLLMAASRVTIIQDVLYDRRTRDESISRTRKTAKHAEGMLISATTLANLYQSNRQCSRATRNAIKKRAIRIAQRYMRVCRRAKVRQQTRQLARCATTLRSPSLLLGAWGNAMLNRARR